MTSTITLVPKKINVDANNKPHKFPIYLMFMIPITIGSFARAYQRNDYSLAVFNLLFLTTFTLVDYFLPWYLSLPKGENSRRKFWLKLTIWALNAIVLFASVHSFSYFLSSQTTMALLTVVSICSAVLLYVFIIADLVSDWKIWRSEEHRSLDAGKSNCDNLVVEKV